MASRSFALLCLLGVACSQVIGLSDYDKVDGSEGGLASSGGRVASLGGAGAGATRGGSGGSGTGGGSGGSGGSMTTGAGHAGAGGTDDNGGAAGKAGAESGGRAGAGGIGVAGEGPGRGGAADGGAGGSAGQADSGGTPTGGSLASGGAAGNGGSAVTGGSAATGGAGGSGGATECFPELLGNGSFDDDEATSQPWQQRTVEYNSNTDPSFVEISRTLVRTKADLNVSPELGDEAGDQAAQLGGVAAQKTYREDLLWQVVVIPRDTIQLTAVCSLWIKTKEPASAAAVDTLTIELLDADRKSLETFVTVNNTHRDSKWASRIGTLSAAQWAGRTLIFAVRAVVDQTAATDFYLDTCFLRASTCP